MSNIISENHFRTARLSWIYMSEQSLRMSETFYYIAKRAVFERQIIRKSQFSKNFDCGMSGTGKTCGSRGFADFGGASVLYGPCNFGKLCGFGDCRNFADVSERDAVPAGTIIEC